MTVGMRRMPGEDRAMMDGAFPVRTDAESLSSRWQELLQEATVALVRMDADRLEELVRCCADLNQPPQSKARSANALRRRAPQATDAGRASLAVMGRLLEETRANLRVLTRLHVLRLKVEAGELADSNFRHVRAGGGGYGDN